MNNQIFISNLVVPIIIGVPDWEIAIPQNLYIVLNIMLKKNDAFNSDNLETIAITNAKSWVTGSAAGKL